MADDNPMQVAAVRLRLEGVPCRMAYVHEFSSWPFMEQQALIFSRAILEPMEAAMPGMSPDVVMLTGYRNGYVLSDGVERDLRDVSGSQQLLEAAMALRGMWMSSGWTS